MTEEDTGFTCSIFRKTACFFLLECLESEVKLDLIYLASVTLDQTEDLDLETDSRFAEDLVLVVPPEQ